MMRLRGGAAGALFIAMAVGLGACGDAETTDRRGYTKAPLEDPGVSITAEPTTENDGLGTPILPQVVDPDELLSGTAGQ